MQPLDRAVWPRGSAHTRVKWQQSASNRTRTLTFRAKMGVVWSTIRKSCVTYAIMVCRTPTIFIFGIVEVTSTTLNDLSARSQHVRDAVDLQGYKGYVA
jgi:hypothetical protein